MAGLSQPARNPWLTGLMILILSVGVAASVSTLTILHMMSADPIPEKSTKLFIPILDNGPANDYKPGDRYIDEQMSYRDVHALLNSAIGKYRTGLYGISALIEMPRKDLVIEVEGMAASRDFFPMMQVPMLYGERWSVADDKNGADVVVLSRKHRKKCLVKKIR
jgi:putative ABC transport system permease protein